MPCAAIASARQAASSAPLVVPAPGCGRIRKAASPSSATRPNTIRERVEIEDRLEERPRVALEDLGHLRRHQLARLRLDPGDDVGPDQRRRDGGAVAFAGCVGADVGEPLRRGRPVPDDVVGALARAASRCCGRAPDRRGTARPAAGSRCSWSNNSRVDRAAARRARRAWPARRRSRRSPAARPAGTARARWSVRRRRRPGGRRARACRRRRSR